MLNYINQSSLYPLMVYIFVFEHPISDRLKHRDVILISNVIFIITALIWIWEKAAGYTLVNCDGKYSLFVNWQWIRKAVLWFYQRILSVWILSKLRGPISAMSRSDFSKIYTTFLRQSRSYSCYIQQMHKEWFL